MVKNYGWIYCMKNPCLRDGICKVGCTIRTPYERQKEANSKRRSKTWIPQAEYRLRGFAGSHYSCMYFKKVKNPHKTEKRLHKLLEKKGNKRIMPNREFFYTSVRNVDSLLSILLNEEE